MIKFKETLENGLEPYLELERKRRRRAEARWGVFLLALTLVLAFPPARRAAAGLLDLLRVERIQVIPLPPGDLAQLQNLGAALSRFGSAEFSGGELSAPLSPAEARSRLGFPPPIPADQTLREPPVVRVRAPVEVRLTLDPEAANAFLRAAGGNELLPSSLRGRRVILHLGAQAVVEYPQEGVALLRGPAPAWEGMDLEEAEALKRAVLSLPGLPDGLRAQLAALGDPRRVLIIPAPEEAVREVEVRGRRGFFLSPRSCSEERCPEGKHCPPEERCPGLFIWMEGETINAIGGRLDLARALSLASSLP